MNMYERIEHQSEPGEGWRGVSDLIVDLEYELTVLDMIIIREDGERLFINDWSGEPSNPVRVRRFLSGTGQVLPGSNITTQDTKGFVKLITFREFNDRGETWQGWEHPDMVRAFCRDA